MPTISSPNEKQTFSWFVFGLMASVTLVGILSELVPSGILPPMESGIYAEGEASRPEKVWGRDRFMPTNFAFLPDGGFFVADG